MIGAVYAWSTFSRAILDEPSAFDLSTVQATIPFEVAIGMIFVGTFLGGRLQDRRGPRPVALAGVTIYSVGIILASLAIGLKDWTKMTDELLAQIDDPAEAQEIRLKMDRIGRLVSSEWAKKSDARRIYLRQVSIWGNALLESLDRDQALELVTQVDRDVDDLLAHKIKPAIITAERYFAADEEDPSGGGLRIQPCCRRYRHRCRPW